MPKNVRPYPSRYRVPECVYCTAAWSLGSIGDGFRPGCGVLASATASGRRGGGSAVGGTVVWFGSRAMKRSHA